MSMLMGLWLPIVLAAVGVWFWNFLSWSILPIHKKDFVGLEHEDAVMAAIRSLNIPVGSYGFPRPKSRAGVKDPAFEAKWKAGPAGLLNVWPANPAMGSKMIASFVLYAVVSVLVGYIGSEALPRGTSFAKVMQVLGTAGVLGYTFAGLPNMIWFNGTRSAKMAAVVDGLIAGLGTGAIFAAFWPK